MMQGVLRRSSPEISKANGGSPITSNPSALTRVWVTSTYIVKYTHPALGDDNCWCNNAYSPL